MGNQCITCGVVLGSKFDHPRWASNRDPVLWCSCCGGEVRGKLAMLKCFKFTVTLAVLLTHPCSPWFDIFSAAIFQAMYFFIVVDVGTWLLLKYFQIIIEK